MTAQQSVAQWYALHGRHTIPWRTGSSRWEVLVAEVMCCQTPVDRVCAAWPEFIAAFPTPFAAVSAGQSALVARWGSLGYPLRARRLFLAAQKIEAGGWPSNLEELPGVGPWVAAAVEAQADDKTSLACDVNIRRLGQRLLNTPAPDSVIVSHVETVMHGLSGRHRLLACLDLAATVCTRRSPQCTSCPLASVCQSRGPLATETLPTRQPRYEGSLRQRRGNVLRMLRTTSVPLADCPTDAVESLIADGLVEILDGVVHLA